jgi:hypothetical protein
MEGEEVALGTMKLLEWPRKMNNNVKISQHKRWLSDMGWIKKLVAVVKRGLSY